VSEVTAQERAEWSEVGSVTWAGPVGFIRVDVARLLAALATAERERDEARRLLSEANSVGWLTKADRLDWSRRVEALFPSREPA
jgi:hypothetical protein